MSHLPWADVRTRNLRDFGACPVCGTWAVAGPYGLDERRRGYGPRSVLTHCGVRWRIGMRVWRESHELRQWRQERRR